MKFFKFFLELIVLLIFVFIANTSYGSYPSGFLNRYIDTNLGYTWLSKGKYAGAGPDSLGDISSITHTKLDNGATFRQKIFI